MATSSNLATLLTRIHVDESIAHISPSMEDGNLWLEAFLHRWVLVEDEFFAIALEKEEKDALSKAKALHLVGDENSVTSLKGYRRPSVVRNVTAQAQAQMLEEKAERVRLKTHRMHLRDSLSKSRRMIQSLSGKLEGIQQKLHTDEQALVESSNKHDSILIESTHITLDASEDICTDFAALPECTKLLQTIARSFGEKYRLIQGLSSSICEHHDGGIGINKQSWIISQAFANLENRACMEEVECIINELQSGVPWGELAGNPLAESLPPTATEVLKQLEDSWKIDEANKLSWQGNILHRMNEHLQAHMLSHLTLFYAGLVRLHSYITSVRALCEVLALELDNFIAKLQALQPELDDDDELLIRLSSLLDLGTKDQGEFSAESVLDHLQKLMERGQ